MSAVERQPEARCAARPENRVGERLLEHGLLTAEQLESALAAQRLQRRPLGQVLLAPGLVDEKALAGALILHFHVPQTDFARARIDRDALPLIPEAYAREHTILPIR